MKASVKTRSNVSIPCLTKKEAAARDLLTREELYAIHLLPGSEPVAYGYIDENTVIYYFNPDSVIEAPPELWFGAKDEPLTLPSGTVIPRMSTKRAAAYGYYTRERLSQMNCETLEEPVAYNIRSDKSTVFFFDKKTSTKLPLMCVRCGQAVRFKKKLCAACYEQDLAERREEGDRKRNAFYGMDRERVLFFDLELTGFYDRDEIISISIVNAKGEIIMNTLVKPDHTKKWKRTEKIHGITPEMTEDAPTLIELTPKIKEIFADADNIIAYGVSTDYSHIKYIYPENEREALHDKVRCCANEFVRYAHEHRPDVEHASLIDAMAAFGIDWDGIPHSSIADTVACMKVWEKLFPNYYKD
ncbi:MAG: 3'-5' exonuclease [Ruminococcaceae bacterium]|nr:3'-5' exonuclease [Oscillospiraceae bacterium]